MPNVAYDTPVYQSRTLGTHYMIHKLRARGSDPFVWNFNIYIVV